tara:strand:+ start:1217 stop:1786 length:570 start_codon:yes stop_codon:yes gene_type:complete
MSTTLLSDIIDLNDPGNESENSNFSNIPFANIPEYNNYKQFSHTPQKPIQQHIEPIQQHIQPSIQPIIKNNNELRYNIRNDFRNNAVHDLRHDDSNYTFKQNVPIQSEPISSIKHIHNPYTNSNMESVNNVSNELNDNNVRELTDKYEELCQICKKVNDNNNMVHAIYITVIATLSIILLLAVKKIMNS